MEALEKFTRGPDGTYTRRVPAELLGRFTGAETTRAKRVEIVDADKRQPRPVQLTKRQLRWLKRNGRSQAYKAGGLAAKAAEMGIAKAEAALDKRARKAAKRVRDAFHSEIGQAASRERLEGRAI